MIKHMINKYLTSISHKHIIKSFNQNSKRDKKATLSLEAYDLYIFLPLWQQVTKKFIENAQCQIDSQAWSSGGGVDKTPRMKASVDVDGAGGVGAGAGGTEAVAGADEVALVSGTGTATDL